MERGTQFIGINPLSDMTEKKSAKLNANQEAYTIEQIIGPWKTYKALLSHLGDSSLTARVLNEDEPDYLGDIAWSSEFTGTLVGGFPASLTAIKLSSLLPPSRISDDVIAIAPGEFTDMYIEVSVRQRGEAPQLLSAHTTPEGDAIVLQFDKEMSTYGLANLLGEDIYGDYGEESPVSVIKGLNNTVAILYIEPVFFYGDTILFSYDASSPIESIDRGLLASFDDFPVLNYTAYVDTEE